ncbi:hypothetical protein [Pseudogemmobacter bohemicus]|uniref:hypothetical protein n=1 Tax=Pseudogemmobacter bohemicus TaxID=2250708 RepID=UPI0013005806|nr:hypothetical protein [Pseudogemmobacter bohemicus]
MGDEAEIQAKINEINAPLFQNCPRQIRNKGGEISTSVLARIATFDTVRHST